MSTQQESIINAFVLFHTNNPNIWEWFKRFAFDAISSGREHYSSNSIFERIRWHVEIDTKGEDVKLNNNYRAYYSRLFHMVYPEHDGFFHIRRCTSADRNGYETYIGVHDSGPPTPHEERLIRAALIPIVEAITKKAFVQVQLL